MRDTPFYNTMRERNRQPTLPLYNKHNQWIVCGCNYHTTWQSKRQMRFVLVGVIGNTAYLCTRITHRSFTTSLDDLVNIDTEYNRKKANELRFDEIRNKCRK